jgi:hypothetical protein
MLLKSPESCAPSAVRHVEWEFTMDFDGSLYHLKRGQKLLAQARTGFTKERFCVSGIQREERASSRANAS